MSLSVGACFGEPGESVDWEEIVRGLWKGSISLCGSSVGGSVLGIQKDRRGTWYVGGG